MVAFDSKWKRSIAPGLAFIAIAAAFVLLLLGYDSRRTRILDSRFHITSVSLLRGTNRIAYISNHFIGRAKDRLAKVGFPVKPVEHGIFGAYGSNFWVSVVYSGSLSPQEFLKIEAQLVSSSGKTFKLPQAIRLPDRNTNNYLGAWMVYGTSRDSLSTNPPSYTLHLSLPDGGPRLAEIRLGRL
jgi:hypothetical protein